MSFSDVRKAKNDKLNKCFIQNKVSLFEMTKSLGWISLYIHMKRHEVIHNKVKLSHNHYNNTYLILKDDFG